MRLTLFEYGCFILSQDDGTAHADYFSHTDTQPSHAEVAALVGNPARANALALLDARVDRHRTRLRRGCCTADRERAPRRTTEGRLLMVKRQGRHAHYRLASPLIGRMLESIMAVAADRPPRHQPRWRSSEVLQNARTCYDHLAGVSHRVGQRAS